MFFNYLLAPFEKKACFSPEINIQRSLDVLPDADEIRLLLLGDFGSGSQYQINIAQKSAITCDQKGCDLVLLLGDNFIQEGVKNIYDPQFNSKFEEIYPQKVPFYAILGNHDLRGNWRAQIEYTNQSDRWTMPDVNYRFLGGPVEFLGINTSCTICSLWKLLKPKSRPWRLVFGHRPMETQGKNRSMTWLEQFFIQFSGTQVYCCGHSHLLEHFRLNQMDQITSGGGGSPLENEGNQSREDAEFLHEGHGYVWVHFDKKEMNAHFFNQEGEEIYHFVREQIKN